MTPQNKRGIFTAVAPFEGVYDVTFEPRKDTRTLRQNAYFHAVIVRVFTDYMKAQSYEATEDECKGYLKDKFLRTTLYHKRTGKPILTRTMDTHELTVEQMSDFIDRCRFWLDDSLRCPTPDPEPEAERRTRVRTIKHKRQALPEPAEAR